MRKYDVPSFDTILSHFAAKILVLLQVVSSRNISLFGLFCTMQLNTIPYGRSYTVYSPPVLRNSFELLFVE